MRTDHKPPIRRTRASPDERPAPRNQGRTAAVHSADSAWIFSPVQSADFNPQYIPQREKVVVSAVDRAADGNQYKYKSPCVIVQQRTPKSRAAAAAAEKRTVMAGGGMVRYSPLSWCW